MQKFDIARQHYEPFESDRAEIEIFDEIESETEGHLVATADSNNKMRQIGKNEQELLT